MKKNILFVDDDDKVISGLKLSLRKYRKEWNFVSALSGDEGLTKLDEMQFDCIVSDMKMPGMSGAEFLGKAKQISPNSKRFILSGEADNEQILNALPVTHQFLSKPCSADFIIDTLKRSFELDTLIEDSDIKSILNDIDILPVRPEIFAKLNNKMNEEDSSLADMADIISEDLGISSKILKVVNSAFFALAREMTNTHDAVSYLGMTTTKNLVLMYESSSAFDLKAIKKFSIEAEYEQSLKVANLVKKLFDNKSLAEDAFSAGMLHRIGRLILAQYFPDKFQIIHDHQDCSTKINDAIEIEVVGITHGQIGAYLLGVWGLPMNIVQGLARQAMPWLYEHDSFELMDALYIARHLVNIDNILDVSNEELLTYFDHQFVTKDYIGENLMLNCITIAKEMQRETSKAA